MKLREEKGYTYGASAGFDLRRAPGPFAARAAVNTEVTAPAIADILAELDRIREAAGHRRRAARPPATSSSASSRSGSRRRGRSSARSPASSSTTCPDDELARYRRAIEAVTADDVLAAARAHIDLDRLGDRPRRRCRRDRRGASKLPASGLCVERTREGRLTRGGDASARAVPGRPAAPETFPALPASEGGGGAAGADAHPAAGARVPDGRDSQDRPSGRRPPPSPSSWWSGRHSPRTP